MLALLLQEAAALQYICSNIKHGFDLILLLIDFFYVFFVETVYMLLFENECPGAAVLALSFRVLAHIKG